MALVLPRHPEQRRTKGSHIWLVDRNSFDCVDAVRNLALFTIVLMVGSVRAAAGQAAFEGGVSSSAEVAIGQRLFFETRFSQCFAGRLDGAMSRPTDLRDAMSCARCHVPPQQHSAGESICNFCDRVARSSVPMRAGGRTTTPRNSPSLVGAFTLASESSLLHFDGEFASADTLIAETFLGRNYGWLPNERGMALHHFASVVRADRGASVPDDAVAQYSYATLLAGTDATVPESLRIPAADRIDVSHSTDEEILAQCSHFVAAFVRSLQFPRDEDGFYTGAPYDAFLKLNRLPRGPRTAESPREYTQRLNEALGALRVPKFITKADAHGGSGGFGESELRGMRIFFKAAVGDAQKTGAGNCAECHTPPAFTDFTFHNTGAAEDEYDGVHSAGAFSRLKIPTLSERAADGDRWLPATATRPQAWGLMRLPPTADDPNRADLGAWNILANPDFPAAQLRLERVFSRSGERTNDIVLARAIGAFKTSTVRNLGTSAPYLHTGRAETLEDVIRLYQRMGELAHRAQMRNAPPEFFSMRLGGEDIEPLANFVRALNGDLRQQ